MPNANETPLYRSTGASSTPRDNQLLMGIGCDRQEADDLVAIMANAKRLGFSLPRVATALGLSAHEQSLIEQGVDARNAKGGTSHPQAARSIDAT